MNQEEPGLSWYIPNSKESENFEGANKESKTHHVRQPAELASDSSLQSAGLGGTEYIVGVRLDLWVGSIGYYRANTDDSAGEWALKWSAGLGGIEYIVGMRLVNFPVGSVAYYRANRVLDLWVGSIGYYGASGNDSARGVLHITEQTGCWTSE